MHRRNLTPALQIALLYAAIAALWIIASDWLLIALTGAAPGFGLLQSIKGLLFVLVTAGLLYMLVRREFRRQVQTEAALAESEQRFRLLFEEAPLSYQLLDEDGRLIAVNQAWLDLLGYTRQEVIGCPFANLLTPEHRSQFEPSFAVAFKATGETRDIGIEVRRRDGRVVPVALSGRISRDPRRQTRQMHCLLIDLSERRRAEQEAERRQREIMLLNRLIMAASSSLKAEDVLAVACRELALTLDVPQTGAALANDNRTAFTVVAECGSISGRSALGESIPVEGNPSLEYVIQRRQPLAVTDAQHDPRLQPIHGVMKQRGVVSLLIVPLIVRGEVVGTIGLDSAVPREFSAEEIALAASAARAVSQALHNAQLYEALKDYNQALEQAVAAQTAEVQRVKERVEAILDNSPDAILLLRPDGTIETANRAFGQLFGRAEPSGQWTVDHIAANSDSTALRKALAEAVEQRRVTRLEITARREDGSTFDAGIALAPFEESNETRVVCSLRDISALKEVERMKDAFVSNVSHELRTPITSLKLHHNLLRLNPDKQDIYMERLGNEIERLSDIIEGLLTLSRIDHDRVAVQPALVDVDRLVASYITDRSPLAERKGLTLQHEPAGDLPPIEADEGLLGQVLGILLTNAITYTPPGGSVRVRSVAYRNQSGEWVGFSVSDTGPGIPPEDEPHLFERFFRGQAAKQSGAPGTGLGLAIAREIVNRHDGRIEVRNNGPSGQGATFSVWLPARQKDG